MKITLKIFIYIIIPLFFVSILYWPLYKGVNIEDSETSLDIDVKSLDLPINDEYFKFFANIPLNRHHLCFDNNNRVYLIHPDSIEPFQFRTGDVSSIEIVKERNIGAMEIRLHYKDSTDDDKFYQKIGQDECFELDIKKLAQYASSTIEYHHLFIRSITPVDFNGVDDVSLMRNIGGSYIDTKQSKLFIRARLDYFIISFVVISLLIWPSLVRTLINLFWKLPDRFSESVINITKRISLWPTHFKNFVCKKYQTWKYPKDWYEKYMIAELPYFEQTEINERRKSLKYQQVSNIIAVITLILTFVALFLLRVGS